ncbi:unnamed protein product [Nezara viridula]|uniref:Uncharacterized protein n=1 Tax=Nezara viridula TaxID=85310 RepID=A0A9P0MR19_NEZVI|nr:unnamed protein product [Nezara viridula]
MNPKITVINHENTSEVAFLEAAESTYNNIDNPNPTVLSIIKLAKDDKDMSDHQQTWIKSVLPGWKDTSAKTHHNVSTNRQVPANAAQRRKQQFK